MGIDPTVKTSDIVQIYKRWSVTQRNSKKLFEPPIPLCFDTGGIGFLLKDGRRFGFEFSSKVIGEYEIRKAIGKKRFRELYSDHASFSDGELKGLYDDLRIWYRRFDVNFLFLMGVQLIYMTIIAILLVKTRDPTVFVVIFVPSAAVFFPIWIAFFMKLTIKWFFIKGTFLRMIELNEQIPDWIEFKGTELVLKKRPKELMGPPGYKDPGKI
jgi:hypothetical protein